MLYFLLNDPGPAGWSAVQPKCSRICPHLFQHFGHGELLLLCVCFKTTTKKSICFSLTFLCVLHPQVTPLYPAEIPPKVVSPLLTVAALRLLADVLNAEEDRLWRSLGDSWNLPR